MTRVKPSPSHLGKVLSNLKANPKLTLTNLKSIKLSLAFRNDHFGARCVHMSGKEGFAVDNERRHFVKELLPRIRYANPELDIRVQKWRKTKEEAWRPEMELEFTNGKEETLNMHEKWSTTILKELMEVAGGDPWVKWKLEATAAGIPVIPGEENERATVKRSTRTPLPSLNAFRASRPTSGQVDTSKPLPEDSALAVIKTGMSAALP
ncbi:hypothetical protein DXG01_004682 [Tephrocybe rancida]|nr:hypothetical protein DXG01_004682 [Tephrocybe rancida]